MKKLFPLVLLVLVLAVSCSPPPVPADEPAVAPTSAAAKIPEALALAFNGLIVLAVTAATVYLSEKIGLDLKGYATPVGTAIGAFIVGELQNYINTIPESFDPWIDMIFKVLLLIAVPAGVLRLRANQPKKLME